MKLKFGMVVTDGAGKLGGNVISRNHYGRFARRYVVPIDPHSPDQTTRRTSFATLSTSYRGLSPVQQAAWAAQCINYPRTNNIGNIYYPTAQTLFVELNSNIVTAGNAIVSTPPAKVIPPTTGGFTLTCSNGSGGLTIHITTPATTANVVYFVRVTSPLSPGINFVTTALRSLYDFRMHSQASESVGAAYVAKYGVPAIGQKIFVQIYGINKISGSQSIRETEQVIVTA